MKILDRIKYMIEDFKAYRRGEVRVGVRGSRGRVYRKKNADEDSSGVKTERKQIVKVTARVFRAKGGPIEHYNLGETETNNG